MARSRAQAASLIASGRVEVRGLKATKAATGVDGDTPVRVLEGKTREYVSRGGYKLAGALSALPGIEVAGRRCLDAGASTGGFTDVLLRRDAAEVVAVDVGYGQLAWSLRTDPRVRVVDRTNVRSLTPEQIGGRVGLTVVDVSFISLGVVLPALVACTADDGDLLPMVKPQFEAGRTEVGKGGVVRDPAVHERVVEDVCGALRGLGFAVLGSTPSPLLGPAGNREFLVAGRLV